MTARVLPVADYGRLVGTDTATVAPHLGPADRIVVLEDGDRIVGAGVLLTVTHLEGLWIDPAYRRGRRVVRLIRALCDAARAHGVRWIATLAVTDRAKRRLQRLGAAVWPGESFVLPLNGERLCRHLQR